MSPTSRIGMAFLVIALLTVIPYTIFKHNGRAEYERMQVEVAEMRAGNVKFAAENRRMSRKIEALRSNPRLIERRAREHLQMARPNELILIFDGPPPALKDATPASPKPSVPDDAPTPSPNAAGDAPPPPEALQP